MRIIKNNVTCLLVNLNNLVQSGKLSKEQIPYNKIKEEVLGQLKQWYFFDDISVAERIEENVISIIDDLVIRKETVTEKEIISTLRDLVVLMDTVATLSMSVNIRQLGMEKFFNEIRYRHHKNKTIVVIGESHVNFFSGNEMISFKSMGNDLNNCQDKRSGFTTIHLGSVLAYNTNKYGTTSRGREKVEWLCENFFREKATIICSMGEIDLRVHVFKEAAKTKQNYMTIIDHIIKNYMEFVVMLKKKGYKIWCWGPIASQKDDWIENPEYPRNGTEIERNRATEYFNEMLESKCSENGIGFLTIFPYLINENYETKAEFIIDQCHLGQNAWRYAKKELQKICLPYA